MGSFIAQILTFLTRVRSGAIELNNSRYERRVDDIHRREKNDRTLSDDELRQQAGSIRRHVQGGTRRSTKWSSTCSLL